MKKNLALRMIMAIAVMFGVQTTASAQLRGLLKKAKKALDVEITVGSENESEEAANNTTTESNVQPEAADQQGGTLQLKPETFIYQPVDDPVNAPLYDINNPKVKEYYDKWIELGNLPNDDQHYWLFEFFDYQSPTRGLKQVHVTEYPLVAYFSYFITHPNDVEGYRCYIRARLAYEILALSSNVHTVPYKLQTGYSPHTKESRPDNMRTGQSPPIPTAG